MASSTLPYTRAIHTTVLSNTSTGKIDTNISVEDVISATPRNWGGAFCSIDMKNGLARIYVYDLSGNLVTNTALQVVVHYFN